MSKPSNSSSPLCWRAAVVVLGELVRSPRMELHALCLADAGGSVDLVGYTSGGVPPAVAAHPGIAVHALPPPARRIARGIAAWPAGLLRVGRQAFALRRILSRLAPPRFLLVQTPPSAPTLAVARGVARRRGIPLVVDWHNLGASLLALRLGRGHGAVRALERWERWFGRRATAGFAVSRALAARLDAEWGIETRVLYDRPARRFRPLAPDERRGAREALAARFPEILQSGPVDSAAPLVVCPTSWTEDEEIELLLRALEIRRKGGPTSSPVAVITGDGPRRAALEPRLAALRAAGIAVRSAWLPAPDYAALLAVADLGICLHRSASGLDLPMKLADLAGAGAPVLALDYGAVLEERLTPGLDGLLFSDAADLAGLLDRLLAADPASRAELARLREGALAAAARRWEDGWREVAWPLVRTYALGGASA